MLYIIVFTVYDVWLPLLNFYTQLLQQSLFRFLNHRVQREVSKTLILSFDRLSMHTQYTSPPPFFVDGIMCTYTLLFTVYIFLFGFIIF